MRRILIIILFFGFGLFSKAQKNDAFVEGMILLQQQKFNLAENSFTTAIDLSLNPDKSYLNRGIARFQQGNYSDAENDFQKAFDFGNSNALLWKSKLFATRQLAEPAVRNLEKYIQTVEVSNPYKLFKDSCFIKIYDSKEWQDFISSFEPNEIQNAIKNSELYTSKKDFISAHQCLDQAISRNPSSAILHEAKALVYEKEGNITLSRFEMKKAVDFNPINTDYLIMLADLESVMHNFNTAENYYKQAKVLSPELISLDIKITKTSLKNNNADEAKNYISEYLGYFPSDTSALFLKAKTDFELENYTEVLKTVNRLMENNRPKAEWFLLRGMTYYKSSTYKYAASDLSMCLDLEPNNVDANYYLGLAEYEKGNLQLACYFWQRALRLGDSRAFDKVAENCGVK